LRFNAAFAAKTSRRSISWILAFSTSLPMPWTKGITICSRAFSVTIPVKGAMDYDGYLNLEDQDLEEE